MGKLIALRENAYKLQHQIQQKEQEYRSVVDSLRDLKKTEPNYMMKIQQEIVLIKEIEQLQNKLMDHKETEQITFHELQQSIRDYHQIDGEYRERLKWISYSWSIVWIVFSVGVGTLFAYKLRTNFLEDLKTSQLDSSNSTALNHEDIQSMINNAIEKQHTLIDQNNLHNINNEHILDYLEQKIVENNQANIVEDNTNEKYIWMAGGLVIS